MKFINKSYKRSFTLGLALSASILISACGGGGGSNTKVGVFTDSPVQGLSYSGPNHSGLTNEKGEYNYEEGDVVTFSLGGIELGDATGAPITTPFDLFGMTPPSTVDEIKVALQDRNSDFAKVRSIVTLLVTLDKDGDPNTDGIDLSGYDALLADFSADDLFGMYGISDNLYDVLSESGVTGFNEGSESQALLHFYESLDIDVEVKAIKKISKDYGNDATVNYVFENLFNSANVKTGSQLDRDNDGFYENVQMFTYNSNGNQTLYSDLSDYDDDGTADNEYRSETTYDDDGRRLTSSQGNPLPGGYNRLYEYVYDAAGNLTSQTYTNDNGNDGADSIEVTTQTYNADGLRLTEIRDRDNNADETVDIRSSYTFTYDTDGNQLTSVFFYDNDLTTEGVNRTETTTSTYDPQGNLLTKSYENDYNGDGTINSKSTVTYTYDDDGNRVKYVRTADNNNDDVIDSTSTRDYTYDDEGRELSYVSITENDNDPLTPPDYGNSNSYTFDDNGNRLSELYSTQRDGVTTSQSRNTYTYDSENRQTSSRYDSDSDGDDVYTDGSYNTTSYDASSGKAVMTTYQRGVEGNYTYATKSTASYNAAGIQTEFTYEEDADNSGANDFEVTYTHTITDGTITSTKEEIDSNADGTVNETNITNYEYLTIADGLSYLLREGLYETAECRIGNDRGFGGLRRLAAGGISESVSRCNNSGGGFID